MSRRATAFGVTNALHSANSLSVPTSIPGKFAVNGQTGAARRFAVLTATAAAIAFASAIAWAANPHFIRATATLDKVFNLVISFKEAGLGSNQLIHYLASANAIATCQCVNHGGKCPAAANKTTESGPVTGEGTFSSDKNGQINASLILSPPDPGDFSCPGNQVVEVAAVSYTNIGLEDTTTPVTASVTPSSLSAAEDIRPVANVA